MSASAILAAGCATTEREEGNFIIDTHTHFYDPSRPQGVPWPPQEDRFLYRTVLPPELKEIAEPLGVKGTVVVEASPWVTDNDWILELASRDRFLLGLVGNLKPGTDSFLKELDRLARNPLFRGIRTGGGNIPAQPAHSDFVRHLARLADRNLSLDILCGPDQLDRILAIARLVPALRIVINHCAGVPITGRAPDDKWVEGIQRVAACPEVCMKVSGLVESTGQEFRAPSDPDFYRPVLDVLWNSFGEERLIFGSNWPVSARFADYKTVLAIVQTYFREKGEAAEAGCFHRNARRVYA